MAEKRRGLGRGLGALIPSAPTGEARPVDVFFPGGPGGGAAATAVATMPAREVDVTEEADDVLGRRGDDQPGSREILSSTVPGQDEPAGGAPQAAEDEDSVAEPDHRALHAVPDPASQDGHRADQGHADLDGADRDDAIPQGGDRGRTGRGGRPTTDAGGARGALVPVPGARFADLPVGAITPNPRQPRTVFDQDALSELVASIAEVGVLQPVVVRPLAGGGDRGDGPRYELIMGERRWRATQGAGLPTIPAIIRETEDSDLLRDALLENLHRSDLNPLEEAAAYQQLLDDFGCTHEELALRIHRSRPQISNMLRLLRLPPTVQRRVAAGVLSAGHARALLGLPDSAAMERLAQRIVAEGLSVRTTEEIVALGGEPERTRRRVRTGERDAALDGLAARLSDRFETRVRIELGKSKGRMTVEFASVEDLHRILETLSPHDATALQ